MRALLFILLLLAGQSWAQTYPSKTSRCIAYLAKVAVMERQVGTPGTRERALETFQAFRVRKLGLAGHPLRHKPVAGDWRSASFVPIAERVTGIESDKRQKDGPQVFAASFKGKVAIEDFFAQIDERRGQAESLLRTPEERVFGVASAAFCLGAGAVVAADSLHAGSLESAMSAAALFVGALDFVAGLSSATDFAFARDRGQLIDFLNRPVDQADPAEWAFDGRNYRIQKALIAALQDGTADSRLRLGGRSQGERDNQMFLMRLAEVLTDYSRGDQPYSSVLIDELLHRDEQTKEPVYSFVMRVYQDRPPRPPRRRLAHRLTEWGRDGVRALVPPSVRPEPVP